VVRTTQVSTKKFRLSEAKEKSIIDRVTKENNAADPCPKVDAHINLDALDVAVAAVAVADHLESIFHPLPPARISVKELVDGSEAKPRVFSRM